VAEELLTWQAPLDTHGLGNADAASKLEPHLTTCLVRRQAAGDACRGFLLHMELQFVVELAFDRSPAPPPTDTSQQPRHRCARRTRRIDSAKCSQLATSSSSRRRPACVRVYTRARRLFAD